MEQASIVFIVAFAFQSVGVLIIWAQLQRTRHELHAMAEFLAVFRMATQKHINRLDNELTKEKQDA